MTLLANTNRRSELQYDEFISGEMAKQLTEASFTETTQTEYNIKKAQLEEKRKESETV